MSLVEVLTPARRPLRRHVAIGDVVFGGAAVPVIAGPCSVEPNYVAHAEAVRGAGARVLRGSIFKPRTRPDSFQGMGSPGLDLLAAARAATGAPVVVEPLAVEHIALLRGRADALMIGARSMQNTPLLRAAGRSGLPVIIKRGMAATYDEWLGACDYVLEEGNDQVILCERGIRTFESATRNTLDVSAVPVLRERTGLPVIVDPSHAAGRTEWVPSLALAAVAAGADGLLVEAHPSPAASWSDPDQAVTPATLAAIIRTTTVLAGVLRPVVATGLTEQRQVIDGIDAGLGALLEERARVVAEIKAEKRRRALPAHDPDREAAVAAHVAAHAPAIPPAAIAEVMTVVIAACQRATTSQTADETLEVRELAC